MRKLNRPLPAPPALSNYDHNIHEWSSKKPSKACRNLIWYKFRVMQGKFCAFCERATEQKNGHIEHFFHKGRKPGGGAAYKHLTFSWDNLFGCCGLTSSNTCGHFKDRQGSEGPGAYNSNELIKPDRDEPKDFFTFLDTGVIEPKPNLSDVDEKRARETLRVLNLSVLNGSRKRQIDIFRKELDELEKISEELDDQALQQALDDIKLKIKQQEHQTAVLEALF
ncbi:TIGR02646 family protein [Vibrio sp. G41H]|uniref:retron Ec78 anti-phage system effector HNH endonuclease PtuB n=1 Tax=unclassified Vibrio TaxID=2614977 RepID=UPI001AD7AB2D|nr:MULTISPECIES: retron Ec78 anti-phage system effector HNH endonuclease PtuB [unclassified Vibrio]MBO7910489.1 TIGR02646 family protein [Vibrio sp. G41H]MCF7489321.1 TIGR02646 family protein [Vibrio sp. G-C-1]